MKLHMLATACIVQNVCLHSFTINFLQFNLQKSHTIYYPIIIGLLHNTYTATRFADSKYQMTYVKMRADNNEFK